MRIVEYIERVGPVARTSPGIPDRVCRVGPHLSEASVGERESMKEGDDL